MSDEGSTHGGRAVEKEPRAARRQGCPVVYLAAGAASAVALVPEAGAGATTPAGVPFSDAGGAQTFTVPVGVTSRSMVTTGAGGGTGACGQRGWVPPSGDRAGPVANRAPADHLLTAGKQTSRGP